MSIKPKQRIGSFLISRGLLSVEETNKIVEIQDNLVSEKPERFGKIAVKAGFIRERELKNRYA